MYHKNDKNNYLNIDKRSVDQDPVLLDTFTRALSPRPREQQAIGEAGLAASPWRSRVTRNDLRNYNTPTTTYSCTPERSSDYYAAASLLSLRR